MVQGVGSVYNIYMLQILKHIFWLVVIIFLFLFNNLLGTFLGHMGSCNSVVENNVHLYTSCRGNTAYLISNFLNTAVISVGDNILTTSATITTQVKIHELAHVRIYHILGPAYLPIYGCSQFAAWVDSKLYSYHKASDSNIIEFWANSLAPSLKP
jgi:hypothetical protein